MTNDQLAATAVPPMSKLELDEFFVSLRELICQCGTNRHELAIVAITACILKGINTRLGIVGALREVGFDRGHVCIVLNGDTGLDPGRHRWRCDDHGFYTAIE